MHSPKKWKIGNSWKGNFPMPTNVTVRKNIGVTGVKNIYTRKTAEKKQYSGETVRVPKFT